MRRRFIFEAEPTWKDYIIQVQQKLKELDPNVDLGTSGPNKDGVDGYFGTLTRKALLKFQLANGAGPNAKGYPGKWTAGKLGLKYVAPPTNIVPDKPVVDNEPDRNRRSKKCNEYEFDDSVEGTRSKVCAGQSRNIDRTTTGGCSEWVKQKTGQWQGNAWHAYKTRSKPSISGFKSFFSDENNRQKAAEVFQKINSRSKTIADAKGRADSDVASMMRKAIPDQSSFQGLKLNDVVGMFYPPSDHHSEAFFQGATGYAANGSQAYNGFFRVQDGNKSRAWKIDDLGKNVKILPGNSLSSGDAFGFNTHLGFVGAKSPNGEPIIFHNVGGEIIATPLSKMGGTFSIVWSRPA